jgi:HAD superfamily hydrolase (TIGR01509 family)
VNHCLDRFALRRFFEIILTKDDVSRRKPDPQIYLESTRRLGLERRAVLVVEDSVPGIRAAKAAGLTCVAVRSSQTPHNGIVEADAVIESLRELEGMLA